MIQNFAFFTRPRKGFAAFIFIASAMMMGACSTNPATGKSQFTALMSADQENTVGASEHKKIIAQFGLYEDQAIQSYVGEVGRKVVQKTERPEVEYKFYVLDSPIVNAFALPGGYIYISRGLLSLANNEAEVASVLGHEAAHITARHSAERYSQSVVTSLGANILGAVIGTAGVSQALGVGSNLYLSSYSRSQENEADTLGIRYLDHASYSPDAMSSFLQNLQNHSALEARIEGRGTGGAGYFSTHPATQARVQKTVEEAKAYPAHDVFLRKKYLQKIDGLTYGDGSDQGLVRGNEFIHPPLGFKFSVPEGFKINNGTSQVAATSKSGAVIVFDMTKKAQGQSALNYLRENWLKNETTEVPRAIKVNGLSGATATFEGTVNNRPMNIRLVAIEQSSDRVARFQIGIPKQASKALKDDLLTSAYSFRRLSEQERRTYRPWRIKAFTARAGDTVASIAAKTPFDSHKEDRFRVLNDLSQGAGLKAGEVYKTVVK